MEGLPFEILLHAVRYLSIGDLCMLRLTSRYLNAVATTKLFESVTIPTRRCPDLDYLYMKKFRNCILHLRINVVDQAMYTRQSIFRDRWNLQLPQLQKVRHLEVDFTDGTVAMMQLGRVACFVDYLPAYDTVNRLTLHFKSLESPVVANLPVEHLKRIYPGLEALVICLAQPPQPHMEHVNERTLQKLKRSAIPHTYVVFDVDQLSEVESIVDSFADITYSRPCIKDEVDRRVRAAIEGA